MSKSFKLALIQMNSQGDFEKNSSFIEENVKKAAKEGAKLIILPEHADAIGGNNTDISTPVPGPVSSFYSRLAKKYRIYLHCGTITEFFAGGKPYNTTLVFDPGGKIAAIYRKLHMFDVSLNGVPSQMESFFTTPGSELSIYTAPLCTMGLSICYDLRFPELFRLLALGGAQLLIVSANFTAETGQAHWEPLLRARAIENGCYVAACNQCGTNAHFPAYGHSMIIDPWGKVIAQCENEPCILYGEFDPEKVTDAKKQIPVLDNLRKDIYKLESAKLNFYNTF